LLTSLVFASLDSVVLTVARPRPVALATSPAVIALPLASAVSTAFLVAPDGVRVLGRDRLAAGIEHAPWMPLRPVGGFFWPSPAGGSFPSYR
jgi:hypothetical protein